MSPQREASGRTTVRADSLLPGMAIVMGGREAVVSVCGDSDHFREARERAERPDLFTLAWTYVEPYSTPRGYRVTSASVLVAPATPIELSPVPTGEGTD